MPANAPCSDPPSQPPPEYSRDDVRRLLNVSETRLKSWERQGLIAPAQEFGFRDLIALRALQKLSESRIPTRQIGLAIQSLKKKLQGIEHPLNELRIVSDGKRISVQLAGQKMEAISGQLLFDFDAADIPAIHTMETRKEPAVPAARSGESEEWFQKGLALEETGAPVDQARDAYLRAIELNPYAAGALVNLGTIAFRAKKLREAVLFYKRAIDADACYPLAHFNLGNVYDELGQAEPAREQYEAALRLNPEYADAHFNLALIAERQNDTMRALKHWKGYLHLDSSSKWAQQARKQLERLRRLTVVE